MRRCLQKDQKRRLRDIRDARIEIDEARAEPLDAIPGTQALSRRNERLAWLFALALVTTVAAIVLGRWGGAPATTPLPEMRVEINTPPTTDPTSLAISPDGQMLAFVATSDDQSRLWLRPFNAVSARPLPDTDGASFPFWSPDSRSVAFFAYGQLRQIGIDGGSPRTLANALGGVGGTWSRDGVILFSTLGSSILRISDRGGNPAPATRLGALYQPGSPVTRPTMSIHSGLATAAASSSARTGRAYTICIGSRPRAPGVRRHCSCRLHSLNRQPTDLPTGASSFTRAPIR